MTDAFEVSDQGGQAGPEQTTPRDRQRQGAAMGAAAVRTVAFVAAVFLNPQRHVRDIDLLDDVGGTTTGLQRPTTIRAVFRTIVEDSVELLRREGDALVLGVAGLAATWSRRGRIGGRCFRWLDDVRRWWLGGRRGILARRRELLSNTDQLGLQSFDLGALSVQLRLQLLTAGTRASDDFRHAVIL